jgi:hypothetical protein
VVRVLRPPVQLEVITEEPPAATPGWPRPCPKDAEDGSGARATGDGAGLLRLVSVTSAVGAKPRIQGQVRVAAGPWNLQTDWWGAEPVERDYWDVELTSGGLYRIFRNRASSEWFADGVYD